MRKRKNKLEQGSGTFLMGLIFMFMILFMMMTLIQTFAMYENALKTQLAADSVATGIALEAMKDPDYSEDDALSKADEILGVFKRIVGLGEKTKVLLDESVLGDDKIRICLVNSEDFMSVIKALKLTGDKSYSISKIATAAFKGNGDIISPLVGITITDGLISSYFGYRNAPTAGASSYHQGIDIGVGAGTPICAVKSGNVIYSGYNGVEGNHVQIDHGDGMETHYKHMSNYIVKSGDYVKQGQVIGYVGSTGVSTGAHLHFSVLINGEQVDPLLYLKVE